MNRLFYMSLTSMLKTRTARDLFRMTFAFQPYRADAEIVAALPEDGNHAAVGIAFDYLARFWLERRHSDVEKSAWIAETGACMLAEAAVSDPQYAGLARNARKALTRAKSEYDAYMRTGDPTDGLMRASIELVELDMVYRTGMTNGVGLEPRTEDIADLRVLLEVIEDGDLKNLRPPLSLKP